MPASFPALMWDGRFRTLEQQAFGPFSTGEMGIDVSEAERRLNSDPEYLRLFRVALNAPPFSERDGNSAGSLSANLDLGSEPL